MTDVRREIIPLLWSIIKETASGKCFTFNRGTASIHAWAENCSCHMNKAHKQRYVTTDTFHAPASLKLLKRDCNLHDTSLLLTSYWLMTLSLMALTG